MKENQGRKGGREGGRAYLDKVEDVAHGPLVESVQHLLTLLQAEPRDACRQEGREGGREGGPAVRKNAGYGVVVLVAKSRAMG